ncbi:hypothetical protein EVAR_41912_1 [Eumeta japonica]|uniref:Uncharacterized protein n=1 Tax=Eumeta variegata TaxID=151549 RepID=A0A4C1XLD9_EUMVA|nr:hypothetical protein EVAR_41912_1 [Eumeta japonica]
MGALASAGSCGDRPSDLNDPIVKSDNPIPIITAISTAPAALTAYTLDREVRCLKTINSSTSYDRRQRRAATKENPPSAASV